MTNQNRGPSVEAVPEDLKERLDALDATELQAVLGYVEQRLAAQRSSLERDIKAEASGDIISIEDRGADALVKMRSTNAETTDDATSTASLYQVRRERLPDGETSLHWSYLGDVNESGRATCESCGHTFSADFAVCPSCGSDDIDRSETEGDT